MDILKHLHGKLLRELTGYVMPVIPISLMIYLASQDLSEYRRLPDQPALLTTAAAIRLADEGARPLVQLTDAQWDCDRLLIVHGKTNSTNIALQTPVSDRLVIVKFWGNESCAGLTKKTMAGVLQPIGATRYAVLEEDGFHLAPFTDVKQVYELCGDCSRQYALSQLRLIVLGLFIVIAVTVSAYIRQRMWPTAPKLPTLSSLPSFIPGQPPTICDPAWVNGKICLDAAGSNLENGAILEISRQGAVPERFTLQYNGRRSHLLAGGHEGSVSGNRLLNDVVPAAIPVTLVAINPDGLSSAPVSFQR